MKNLLLLLFLPCLVLAQPSPYSGPFPSPYSSNNVVTTMTYGFIQGKDNSVNFDTLNKFYQVCFNNNRAIRIFTSADQNTYLNGGGFYDMFGGYFGRTGGLDSGDGLAGAVEFDNSGGVTSALDATVWYASLYSLHNTDTMTCRRRDNNADQTISGTNFIATAFQVRYVIESGAGTFKVQTNSSGGGWNDVTGGSVNANGATAGGVLTLTFAKGFYSVRLLGTAGTVRIQGMGLWNDTIPSITSSFLGTSGGTTPTNFSAIATNVSWPWLAAIAPDLVIIYDTGDFSSTLPMWQFFSTNIWPNASQIWCGQFLETTVQYNPGLKSQALLYNVAYNDGQYDLGTNISALITGGFMNADRVHLTDPLGCTYMNQKLIRKIISGAGNWTSGYTDPKFKYGTQVGTLNIGNTNHVGIGTATPRTMLEIDDTLSRDFLGDGADNSIGFWMFNSGSVNLAKLTVTNAIMSVSDGFVWMGPPGYRSAGSALIVGQPFVSGLSTLETIRFYGNAGGVAVGNAQSDPGAGIISAQNGFLANSKGFSTLDGAVVCPINTNFLATSAGTVYTLTASYASTAFGTTSPNITIQNTGSYIVRGRANFVSRGATYAATNTYSIKLRKTSGTPADVAGTEAVQTIPIITTTTQDLGLIETRPAIFSATAGDVLQLWGVVSATPSAGNVICDRADIEAIRLY